MLRISYILFYQVNDDAYVGTGYYNTAGAVVDIKMATLLM